MEDILEVYRNVMAGQPNQDVLSYDSINLHFSGNFINLYDYTGAMPCGRYKLPPTEAEFIEKLEQLNDKVSDILANQQFICGKCGKTFDLPETKRDRFGAYICEHCANGGDIRKTQQESTKTGGEKVEPTKPKSEEPKATPTPSTVQTGRLTVESATKFLQDQGFVVKKLVKSFRIVAQDGEGSVGVTEKYYRSREEFEQTNPKLKFISIVKELSTSDEEKLE